MRIDPSEIKEKKFGLSFYRGYNQAEVDKFLKKIGRDYQEVLEEKRALFQELEKLKKEAKRYISREEKIEEALISAQKSAQLIDESSRERGELIIKEAEIKAKKIIQKGEESLQKLQNEIAKLQGQKRLFLVKLKSLIETHTELLHFYEEEFVEEKSAAKEGKEEPKKPIEEKESAKKEIKKPLSTKDYPLFSSRDTHKGGILFEE